MYWNEYKTKNEDKNTTNEYTNFLVSVLGKYKKKLDFFVKQVRISVSINTNYFQIVLIKWARNFVLREHKKVSKDSFYKVGWNFCFERT